MPHSLQMHWLRLLPHCSPCCHLYLWKLSTITGRALFCQDSTRGSCTTVFPVKTHQVDLFGQEIEECQKKGKRKGFVPRDGYTSPISRMKGKQASMVPAGRVDEWSMMDTCSLNIRLWARIRTHQLLHALPPHQFPLRPFTSITSKFK